ncbi:hypothetical protein [Corynebacterium provencense]|uniref:hypothetical protein n=1 Tax=Corynebacterium provencense TaxID=1737425 RepID=UPI000A90DA01|nr:hypothetical protein [Corynebacterium provencense]
MTVVKGNFRDIAGADAQGWVILSSVFMRPSEVSPGVMVTTARHKIKMQGGLWTSPELDPGPMLVELDAAGVSKRWEITVPLDGEHEFADLVDEQVDYSPEVVSRAQAAARAAAASATAAAESAAVVGSAEAVLSAAEAAEVSRVGAEDARGAAAASATAAAVSATAASESAVSADSSATSASESAAAAEAAEESATAAANAADSANRSAQNSSGLATTQATLAASSRDEAAQAANSAIDGYLGAKASATAASDSAAAAASSAALAQSAASVAADDVRDELSGLVSTASGHASDAADSAAAAAQSAQDAASVVSDGVPDASTSMKGKVKLAGDLGGTADSPTVPGLAGKSDVGHSHAISDVTDLQSTLDGKVSTVGTTSRVYGTSSTGLQTTYLLGGTNAASGTIAFRTTGGAIVTGEPTADNHAATKASVERRPALFSGPGYPPSTLTGAVVGDWWLNTTTMELWKITGV